MKQNKIGTKLFVFWYFYISSSKLVIVRIEIYFFDGLQILNEILIEINDRNQLPTYYYTVLF